MSFIGPALLSTPWDVGEIRRFHVKWIAEYERDLLVFCNKVGDDAVRNAQRQKVLKNRTFALKRGWKKEISRLSNSIRIRHYSRVPHAMYHEFGTGIFGPRKRRIYPIRAKCLRWVTPEGKVVFARSVKGVPPRFIAKSATFDAFKFGKPITSALTRAAKRF